MPPKLTQPLRPVARYRPGKAPVPVADDSDYSDQEAQQQDDEAAQEEQDNDEDADEQVTEFRAGAAPARAAKGGAAGAINVALKQVEVDQAGKVKVGGRDEVGRTEMESSEGEYETDSEEEAEAPSKPVFRPKAAQTKEESSEYETDSEEESEEEEPLKPIYKPVFVSKRNRDTITERQKELDPEALEAKREEEDRKRREEAKALVADSIVREIASKEAQEVHPDVDDTDGLDPEGEFEAWKLRELTRLKRDREARYALEKVREEVEARRAMPEELRIKEDTERAEKSRKEKQRGQQAFLQKYHHKGVFHQDMDILKKHDYTAPTESTITDVSSLPAVMQKRNFGKAHQTKYTHLAAEDTSRQSGGWGRPGGGGAGGGAGAGGSGAGCFICGGPHLKRDCPQLAADGGDSSNGGGPTVSGANAAAAGRGGDSGWGARRPPDSRDRERAPPPPGRRGGIGFERDRGQRREYGSNDPDGDSRDWRSRGGGRDRSRSRSPPRRRYEAHDDRRRRDPPPSSSYRSDRDRDRDDYSRERRRSRSRSPGSRRRGDYDYDRDYDRDREDDKRRTRDAEQDPEDRRRRDDRPERERERDDKRRRLD
ncbi:hypothetical protein JCM10908_006438 [Rhodotorula pacifica]|uniref:microfibrillar-associated 1 family protein n=1 Tax=Rhodotorula pacifica TaxID=1495444 RepID=UPI003176B0C4